jgi:hypothetical protein
MSKEFFSALKKTDIFANPSHYPWNCLLMFVQFTQDELLLMKDFIEVRELIRFQTVVTKQFLRDHFQKEIDDCLEVDWNDVDKYVKK